MFDFSTFLPLPFIFGGLAAIVIFLYVLLDGFDLGIGILFPFAPSHQSRDSMMNSIAPFWDSNETWLVLGGVTLLAAFPLAYSILLSAFYIPIILMLLGLIFRGVAFEFRFKSSGKYRFLWDYAFHFGSLIAAFMQGVLLGGFVQGVKVAGRDFAGTPFDWLSSFSLMTGTALLFGYALLGATWLVMKTEGETQNWARRTASYVLLFVGFFMGLVSAIMPFLNPRIATLWFSLPHLFYLLPIPILTAFCFLMLWRDLLYKRECRPFFLSIVIFLLGYIGIAISLWPWIIPYEFTLMQAAASSATQSLLFVGIAVLLPIILLYTGYAYYVFRGKSSHEKLY